MNTIIYFVIYHGQFNEKEKWDFNCKQQQSAQCGEIRWSISGRLEEELPGFTAVTPPLSPPL